MIMIIRSLPVLKNVLKKRIINSVVSYKLLLHQNIGSSAEVYV